MLLPLFMVTLLSGCQSSEEGKVTPNNDLLQFRVIEGTAGYRERIALPPQAEVIITLEDVSKADAPSKVMATHRTSAKEASSPFAFKLRYFVDAIQDGHTYTVRAKIVLEDKLLFTTDTVTPVINDKDETHNVDLLMRKVSRNK